MIDQSTRIHIYVSELWDSIEERPYSPCTRYNESSGGYISHPWQMWHTSTPLCRNYTTAVNPKPSPNKVRNTKQQQDTTLRPPNKSCLARQVLTPENMLALSSSKYIQGASEKAYLWTVSAHSPNFTLCAIKNRKAWQPKCCLLPRREVFLSPGDAMLFAGANQSLPEARVRAHNKWSRKTEGLCVGARLCVMV